jgi:hypothetical protein
VLSHEVVLSVKPVVDVADPVLARVREGFHLDVVTSDYAHWAAAVQESRELSYERGMQLDAEQGDAEE